MCCSSLRGIRTQRLRLVGLLPDKAEGHKDLQPGSAIHLIHLHHPVVLCYFDIILEAEEGELLPGGGIVSRLRPLQWSHSS